MEQQSPRYSVQLDHINSICQAALRQVESDEPVARCQMIRRDFEDQPAFLKADTPKAESDLSLWH